MKKIRVGLIPAVMAVASTAALGRTQTSRVGAALRIDCGVLDILDT